MVTEWIQAVSTACEALHAHVEKSLCWYATQYTLDGQEALAHAAPRHMLQLGDTFHCGVLPTLMASWPFYELLRLFQVWSACLGPPPHRKACAASHEFSHSLRLTNKPAGRQLLLHFA